MDPNWTAALAVWREHSPSAGNEPSVIAAIEARRDNAVADGRHANLLTVSTLYALGAAPAPYVDVKIDVLDQNNERASDVGIFYDAWFSKPVSNLRIQTDSNGSATLFLNCNAQGARRYRFTATPVWPSAETISQFIHFSRPVPLVLPQGTLSLNPTNGNRNIACMDNLTTPLQVQVALQGIPVVRDAFVGSLIDVYENPAGEVLFDIPISDEKGELVVKIFPYDYGRCTLVLKDLVTRNEGRLPLVATVFKSIVITSDPEIVTDPCPDGVKLSVSMTLWGEETQHPDSITLQWRGADPASQKYFAGSEPIVTSHYDPTTFQYTTTPVTKTDLQTYELGNIFVALDVYGIIGTGTPFTIYHRVPFVPALKGLEPPVADFTAHITDAALAGCAELPGLPFDIPIVDDPLLDDTALILLYGRTSPGPLDHETDQPIAAKLIERHLVGKTVMMFAPLINPIFQKNGSVDLYYVIDSGNQAYSQPLRLDVDRDSLKTTPLQVSDYLTLPTAIPGRYFLEDYTNNVVLAVRVDFLGRIKPEKGGAITVRLDLTGGTEANLNVYVPLALARYTITEQDLAYGNQNVVIVFDKREGDRAGFLPQALANIDWSEGKLYYVYEPVAGSPIQSRARNIEVDTVSPHTGIRMAKQRRRGRGRA
ncbi:hypothetical protein CAL14_17710 [Bordetella genomosp. 9]|uniref:hypothetical protein n=1 Tax=Bordetella genomosp. 9 TaxID=1416803 RepID=UPI000A296038|nr:hypothetical protein [Bordetella genomosp. 9]ARP91894.1 hypothetical protein CAL14_17710 [Bordetella genomosp. 9]